MIILIYQFKKWLIEKIKLLEREMENYYLRKKLSFDGKSERDRLVRNNPRDNSLSNLLLENLETILIIFSFLTIAWFRVTINVTKFHSIRGLHTCNRNHYRETIAANQNVARSNWQQRHGAIVHTTIVHVPMKRGDVYKYVSYNFQFLIKKLLLHFDSREFLRHLIEVCSFQGNCLKRCTVVRTWWSYRVKEGEEYEIVDSGKRLKTVDKIQDGGWWISYIRIDMRNSKFEF